MKGNAGSLGDSWSESPESRSQALVTGAQRGEREALDQLIEAHLDDLRAYVRLHLDPRLRTRESSSDVVQSICREVLEDLPGFEYRGEGSFRAWLFTAALNKVRQKGEFHRAHKRDVALEVQAEEGDDERSVGADLYASLCGREATPSQHAIAHERAARIERAMDKLPTGQRDVLLLARIVGLSHREIAARVGRTEGAVSRLVSDATVRLLAAIEKRS